MLDLRGIAQFCMLDVDTMQFLGELFEFGRGHATYRDDVLSCLRIASDKLQPQLASSASDDDVAHDVGMPLSGAWVAILGKVILDIGFKYDVRTQHGSRAYSRFR